jgi:hypothetical protein
VAGATSPRFSIVSGGVLCVLGVAAVVVAFPAPLRYDAEDWVAAPVLTRTGAGRANVELAGPGLQART